MTVLSTEMKASNPRQILCPEVREACRLECSERHSANLCIGPFVLSEGVVASPVTITKAESLACAP